MEKSDIDIYSKTDLYYLATIGEYIRSNRISQNKTQLELAEDAGINRATLSQLEKGKPVNILSLIQVLRALKRLHILHEMEVKPQLSPMQFAALEQKQRLRVKRKTSKLPKQQSDW